MSWKKRFAFGAAGALSLAFVVSVTLWVIAPFCAPPLDAREPRVPSVVWSRPAVLDPALPITREEVTAMLRRRGYVEEAGASTASLLEGRWKPDRDGLVLRRRAYSTGDLAVAAETLSLSFESGKTGRLKALKDGRGNALPRAALDPELLGRLYGKYWHDRLPLALDEMPPHLVTAVLEVEDRRFYAHNGIDVRRIAGAFLANLRAGGTVQGGSTITQQLVKNLWLTRERTVWRKTKEAWLSYALERKYTKDEILEAYLNEIYLGQRGPVAVYGVGQAAFHYFGKDAKDLNLAESAFLAGTIRAPGRHSPHKDPAEAARRRDVVLGILEARGKIDAKEKKAAGATSLRVRAAPVFDQPAPFATAWVRRALAPEHDDAELESRGLQVHSTIDARLQRIAGGAVERQLSALERRFPKLLRKDVPLQAAVVVLTPHTGEILALVGGRDWQASQFDRATQARRQPGSAFKPVVTLAALTFDGEERITLSTLIDDEPLEIRTKEKGKDLVWRPQNYDREFRGVVTLRETLQKSLNVPMVRIGQQIGLEHVIETARRLGIESALEPVPSLALGSGEVTPLELAQAYAVLASGGLYSRPTALHAVRGATGELLSFHGREVEVRYTPAETYLVTSALEGAGGELLRKNGWEGPIAGKTGTSDQGRDLWFVGYTPDLVVGVWVGFDDGTPTGLAGATGAAPIFAEIVRAALGPEYDREFTPPEGLERVRVHRATAERAGFGCSGRDEWFLEGTAPTATCGVFEGLRSLFD